MAKGFSGVPGNMQAILKQAQQMQKELQKAQEEVKTFTAEGTAGGGVIKAVANGSNQLTSIEIDKEVVDPNDIDMLQDLVLAAANEALTKVQSEVQAKLEKATGGMNIPGLV